MLVGFLVGRRKNGHCVILETNCMGKLKLQLCGELCRIIVIEVGGSSYMGMFGYLKAFEEMMNQVKQVV